LFCCCFFDGKRLMQTVIIMIHLMVVLALIGTVLLQRSEGGGLGSGSTGASFMSSRGTANMLTRTTAILAAVFFATSLLLSVLAGMGHKPTSIFGGASTPAPAGQSQEAPLAPPGGGLLDTLKGGNQGQAPAPAGGTPPSGPQVPQSR
jgi:preprotein translocase subunit SecG